MDRFHDQLQIPPPSPPVWMREMSQKSYYRMTGEQGGGREGWDGNASSLTVHALFRFFQGIGSPLETGCPFSGKGLAGLPD